MRVIRDKTSTVRQWGVEISRDDPDCRSKNWPAWVVTVRFGRRIVGLEWG